MSNDRGHGFHLVLALVLVLLVALAGPANAEVASEAGGEDSYCVYASGRDLICI